MSFYDATGDDRTAMVKGLRELADFLDGHPDVPVPRRIDVQLSTWGEAMAERMDSVDHFALAAGVRPDWVNDEKTHYTAMRKFGPLEFFCVAIDRSKDGEAES